MKFSRFFLVMLLYETFIRYYEIKPIVDRNEAEARLCLKEPLLFVI